MKEDGMGGTCGMHGEGMKPLGRPRRRWEDNIKMDLREIGIDGANWIPLAQERVRWRYFVSMVMNLRVPYRRQDTPWQVK
jgi:hypothetical protein